MRVVDILTQTHFQITLDEVSAHRSMNSVTRNDGKTVPQLGVEKVANGYHDLLILEKLIPTHSIGLSELKLNLFFIIQLEFAHDGFHLGFFLIV